MKFGLGQTSNPTPHKISMLIDFLATICGVIAAFLTVAEFIPHKLSDILSPILTALIIPILLAAKRFFGEEVDATKIPIGQVSEIKEADTGDQIPKRE